MGETPLALSSPIFRWNFLATLGSVRTLSRLWVRFKGTAITMKMLCLNDGMNFIGYRRMKGRERKGRGSAGKRIPRFRGDEIPGFRGR
jgi:hypothetical protein